MVSFVGFALSLFLLTLLQLKFIGEVAMQLAKFWIGAYVEPQLEQFHNLPQREYVEHSSGGFHTRFLIFS